MKDMILPFLGTIVEYTAILSVTFNRYDISDWMASFPGGELVVFIGAYLISILIVTLWCRMRPFNMFMSGLDT